MDVLLVDDNPVIRWLISESLAAAGLQVTEAGDPYDALDLPWAQPPTVLVADINLGSAMNGFGLADAARARWPAICVVYISGVLENEHTRRLGPAERFLAKPFTARELLRMINEVTEATCRSLRDRVCETPARLLAGAARARPRGSRSPPAASAVDGGAARRPAR